MRNLLIWKDAPCPVRIKCTRIADSYCGEVVVQFVTRRGFYTAFGDKRFVDEANLTIGADVVAEVGGSWLVDLPMETLTSGRRIRIDKDESVIIS